eukprot:9550790-Alexandrium_andersonii.AAC.1
MSSITDDEAEIERKLRLSAMVAADALASKQAKMPQNERYVTTLKSRLNANLLFLGKALKTEPDTWELDPQDDQVLAYMNALAEAAEEKKRGAAD